MKQLWKALPESVRAAAHVVVQSVADRLTPRFVRMNWKPGLPRGGPVTLAGFYRSSLGIGRGVRLLESALDQGNLHVQACDLSEALQVGAELGCEPHVGTVDVLARGASGGGVLLTHFNPPELYRWIQRTRGAGLRGRRHIGYWAWELPALPPSWRRAFDYVDEVWCPSNFTAEAVRAAAPAGLPVRVVAHPIFMTPRVQPAREMFDFPPGACVVLTAFDLKSTLARKNPLGAIEAYRRAVPKPDGRSLLVCKLTSGRHPAEKAMESEVAAAIGDRSDILLMRQALSEADMGRLIASADIVLSLHRAEGFGLLAAEGLWFGKPVVATAWSGVMDFLDAESAVLVPWTQSPVQDSQAMYKLGWWAEPDIAFAAGQLRRLIDDSAARAEIGQAALSRAEQVFDAARWLSGTEALLLDP